MAEKIIALDGNTMLNACKVAGNSIDALRYLQESLDSPQLYNTFVKTDQTKILSVIQTTVSQQIDYLISLAAKRKPWSGDVNSVTKYQPSSANFQRHEAEEKVHKLYSEYQSALLRNITLVYQIDDRSQLLRGYICNGKALNEKNSEDAATLEVVDQVFQSWLVENQMTCKDGVIYSAKETDKADTRVIPEKFSSLLTNPTTGLTTFAHEVDANLNLTVQQHQAAPQEQPS